ncbi:unnamed protein product [Blepharisma stoltei]|uniref:Uncharacterized protein n=1 Tax=Blepharisma stoltei TaxID=1481888 RepID=A0AAU9JAN6_9CILI|nr:unnamed protein product [Blepharisma stoltei]
MNIANISLYDRGILAKLKKQEMIETVSKEKNAKEIEEIRNAPKINARSKWIIKNRVLNKGQDDNDFWSYDSPKKSENISYQPTQDSYNSKKSYTPDGYQSPIGAWEERVKQYFDTKNQVPFEPQHIPQINETSRSMCPITDEKVENRLLRIHKEKIEKIETIRKDCIEEIPSFSPKINKWNMPRPENTSDYLYYSGINHKIRKEKAIETIHERSHSFKPTINNNANELAYNWRNRLIKIPENTNEEESKVSKRLNNEEFGNFIERNYEKPLKKSKWKIDKINKWMKPRKSWDVNLYEKGIKSILEKDEKVKARQEEKNKAEISECTFQPQLTPRSKTPPLSIINKISPKKEGYRRKLKACEWIKYWDKSGNKTTLALIGTENKDILKELEELESRVFLSLSS